MMIIIISLHMPIGHASQFLWYYPPISAMQRVRQLRFIVSSDSNLLLVTGCGMLGTNFLFYYVSFHFSWAFFNLLTAVMKWNV